MKSQGHFTIKTLYTHIRFHTIHLHSPIGLNSIRRVQKYSETWVILYTHVQLRPPAMVGDSDGYRQAIPHPPGTGPPVRPLP